jgi:hypothetical protein
MRNGVRMTTARMSEMMIPHVSEKWNEASIAVSLRVNR